MNAVNEEEIKDLYFGLQTHLDNINAAVQLQSTNQLAKARYIVDEARRVNCIAQAIENKLRLAL